MAKRSTRRSSGDAGLDDPYAWKGDKKSTGKKKRKKKRSSSADPEVEEVDEAPRRRSSKSKKTTKRSKGSSARSSSSTSSARGTSARKSARGTRKSGRSSSEEGSASSARRRRAPPPKKKGADPIIFISIITATLLICGGIIFVSNMGGTEIVKDEQALFDQAKDLQEKGMKAYRDWNQAIRDGNSQLELDKHKEALQALQDSMAKLDEALKDHQGDPEYEGYDSMYMDLTQHLIDLEKGGRVH